MKYRDILGYSKKTKKKKVVKEQPKPTVTDVLKEQFGDRINEGSLDWEKRFPEFKGKELKAVEHLIWTTDINTVLAMRNKGKRKFEKLVKDLARKGIY